MLVDRTVLARVVQNVSGATWVLWQVPHSHCFVVDRFTLFKHVERDELHLPADHSLPEHVLLLERPTTDQLNGSRPELLGRYWRLLFHASVHRELDQHLADLSPAAVRERVEEIGPSAFEVGAEVRDAFVTADADSARAFVPGRAGKWFADLNALARRRLACAGVTQVFGIRACTFSDATRFFSYRRDGPTGRMGAFIWRTAR